MASRTSFLAKLIGLYFILAALSMSIRGQGTVQMVTEILHDSSLMFLLGVITLIAGLAMVLAHNVWSGGALRVTVTLIGWITLIKGLLFLFLPAGDEPGFFLGVMHYQQLFYVYVSFVLLIGIWFTYRGFSVRSQA
jgi:hypothetical protein